MKKLIFISAGILIVLSSFAQTKWTLDPAHSSIVFSVGHMGISFIHGSFKKFDGNYTAEKADLSDANIHFTVDVNSISTDVEARDNHLKSDDFFNAASYPAMKFESSSFKKTAGKNYKLSGNLTIRDVTKPVVFDVVYMGTVKDNRGNTKSGFKANTTINRQDYHIKYDPTGKGVASEVAIELNLEFTQNK